MRHVALEVIAFERDIELESMPSGTGTSIVTLLPSTTPFAIGNCSLALGPAVPVSLPPSCFKIRWIVSSCVCPSGLVIFNVPLQVPEISAALAARARTTDSKNYLKYLHESPTSG